MENNSKIQIWISTAKDSLMEQEWVQQIKAKWEELDSQSRNYLKFASIGAAILAALFIAFGAMWNVRSLKKELAEKRSLLESIDAANDEIRRLKEMIPQNVLQGMMRNEGGPWDNYFDTAAATAGLDKSVLSVSSEKPGNSGDQSKEVLYDLNLKHVNIKQIVRYILALENGQRPVKLRNLNIDTKSDPSGYLDATLAISGFSLVEQK